MTKTKKITLTVAAIMAIAGSANHADAFGGSEAGRTVRFFNFFRCRCASRACERPDAVARANALTSAAQPRLDCDGQCLVNPVEEGEPLGADQTDNDLSSIERELIAEAIRVRGRFLAIDRLCCQRSRRNSDAQASYCLLGHFTGSAYEIAGVGYGSPAAAVQGWLNSPAHRAILLRSDFTKVGAAVRRGRDGRLYWTMNFAR